jgi:hypothetical protein
MWPFPQKYLQWREPQNFVRRRLAAEERRASWWCRPGVVLSLTSVGMLTWWVSPHDTLPLANALALSLLFGVLMTYGFPWLFRFLPSQVGIFEKHIQVSSGDHAQRMPFSRVASFCWRQESGYRVLTLRPMRRRLLELGVPYDIPATEMTRLLASHGLQEEPPSRT